MNSITAKIVVCSLLLLAFVSGCGKVSPEQAAADLVIKNARIWTSDAERPWAQALAVRGERLVVVGDNADVANYIGSGTEIIDAPVLPQNSSGTPIHAAIRRYS